MIRKRASIRPINSRSRTRESSRESDGDERSISPRGAMGLMQLMPGTWVELSARYRLGLDPFDARNNILAGTAYLKEMHDRFGSAGFLAAYHAGPWRHEQRVVTGKPLPSETTAYVAAVTPLLDNEEGEHAAVDGRRALPWREAPLGDAFGPRSTRRFAPHRATLRVSRPSG